MKSSSLVTQPHSFCPPLPHGCPRRAGRTLTAAHGPGAADHRPALLIIPSARADLAPELCSLLQAPA